MRQTTPHRTPPTQGKPDFNRTVTTRARNYRQPEVEFTPQLAHTVGGLQKRDNYNILKFLDQRDRKNKHQYKLFQNHSKVSDLAEIKSIIEELLDKHATERSLCSSQQYILVGYLQKYMEYAESDPKLMRNPFHLTERLETHNRQTEFQEVSRSPRTLGYSKTKSMPKKSQTRRTPGEEKRAILLKELEKIKFIWQIYQLRSIVCPNLTRLSESEQAENRRELLEMIGKLKSMERVKNKLTEQKAMQEVGKIMKRFEARIKVI